MVMEGNIKYVFTKVEIPCSYLSYNIEAHVSAFLGKASHSFSADQSSLVTHLLGRFLPASPNLSSLHPPFIMSCW